MPASDRLRQRLLVISLEGCNAIQPALVMLQHASPNTDIWLLESGADWTATPLVSNAVRFGSALKTISFGAGLSVNSDKLLQWMRDQQFDAALIFTAAHQSPYTLAYLCYGAGIPVRVGQSVEFGGRVLSHCFIPPEEGDRHLNLVEHYCALIAASELCGA